MNLGLVPNMSMIIAWKTAPITQVGVHRKCSIMVQWLESIKIAPIAIPAKYTSTLRRGHVDLRTRLQQIGDSVGICKGWKTPCSNSPANDTDASVVSKGKEEQTVAADTLEFDHKVALDVVATPDLVWKLWTDLKSAPQWMRWIDRVEFLPEDQTSETTQELSPGLSHLSRWICSTAGFEVMWVARVEYVQSAPPVRVLRWATVEGLQSQGEVTFKENESKGTTVELSISHSLPAALGRVMHSGALRGLVQATLQSDLVCFQKYAAKAVSQQRDSACSNKGSMVDGRGSFTITTNCSQGLGE